MWPGTARGPGWNGGKSRVSTSNQIIKNINSSTPSQIVTSNVFKSSPINSSDVRRYQDFSTNPVKIKPMQTQRKRISPPIKKTIIDQKKQKPLTPIMPIIVNTISLNTDMQHTISGPSEEKSTSTESSPNIINKLNTLPNITHRIIKKSAHTKKSPNTKKPIETINLDDDDDDDDSVIDLVEEDSPEMIAEKIDNYNLLSNAEPVLTIEEIKISDIANFPFNINKYEKENCKPITRSKRNSPKVHSTNHNATDFSSKNKSKEQFEESCENLNQPIIIDDICSSESEICTSSKSTSRAESENESIDDDENDDILLVDRKSVVNKSTSPHMKQPSPDKTSNSSINKKESNFAIKEINEYYCQFLDLCLKLEDSVDMKIIIDKKLKNYYQSVDSKFTNSDRFRKFIEEKMAAMIKAPKYKFIHIKEVADELKSRRSKVKKKGTNSPSVSLDNSISSETKNKETEEKINHLERKLKIYRRVITRLDEQEVDFDNEDVSAYVLVDRYKSKFMDAYKKLCVLKSEEGIESCNRAKKIVSKLPLGRGRIPLLNNAVENLATTSPNWFPDFHDILKCVRHCVSLAKLDLSDREIRNEASLAFIEIGKALQKKRQTLDYQHLCDLLLEYDEDPANRDPELASALEKNSHIFKQKEMDLINKYANGEHNLKLNSENCEKNVMNSPSKSDLKNPAAKKRVDLISTNPKITCEPTQDDSDIEMLTEPSIDEENTTSNSKIDSEKINASYSDSESDLDFSYSDKKQFFKSEDNAKNSFQDIHIISEESDVEFIS